MTECLEGVSYMLGCYYPHPRIQEFFLEIHSHFFYNCTEEETPFVDAPHGLVVALTLIPVSLIPILVYRVVWNSKVLRWPVAATADHIINLNSLWEYPPEMTIFRNVQKVYVSYINKY